MNTKKILFGLILMSIFAGGVANAATGMSADELRAEIARLSRVADTIRAQLLKYGNDPSTVQSGITNPNQSGITNYLGNSYTNGCLQSNKQMHRKHSGGSVSTLQQFLVEQGVYSASLVTGYFGPATEAGVQAWQSNHGVVSYGTPESTGYGLVGPATLRAMHAGCPNGTYSGPSGSLTDNTITTTNTHTNKQKVQTGAAQVERYSLSLNPTRGLAPLNVTADFTIAGSTCTSYLLDWGDGSLPVSYNSNKNSGCTTLPIKIVKRHIYNNSGTHHVIFKTGKTQITKIKTVSTLDVEVIGAPRPSY